MIKISVNTLELGFPFSIYVQFWSTSPDTCTFASTSVKLHFWDSITRPKIIICVHLFKKPWPSSRATSFGAARSWSWEYCCSSARDSCSGIFHNKPSLFHFPETSLGRCGWCRSVVWWEATQTRPPPPQQLLLHLVSCSDLVQVESQDLVWPGSPLRSPPSCRRPQDQLCGQVQKSQIWFWFSRAMVASPFLIRYF